MLGLGFGLNRGRRIGGFVGLLDLYPNAAAAYSLRKLRAAYSGSAVRVRRSSDNTEQDIGFTTQGELDTSSLLSFVNENVDIYTSDFTSTENLSEFNGTGAAAQSVGGVDDAYKFTLSGGAGSHFAFRTIHEVGKSYEVSFDVYIPSSNSAVDGVLFSLFGAQDIVSTSTTDEWVTLTATYSANYVNGNFYATDGGSKTVNGDNDVFYLKNIVVTQTTADGFVTVWYDQSGNGNDAVNTTLTEQPKIVSSSALVEENGKVAIDFDGVNDELNFSGDIPATEVSSIIVAKAITSTINNRFFGWRNSSFSFLSVLVQGASSTSLRSLSETDDGTQGLLYSGVDYTDNSLISMYNASVWRINGNEFTGEVSLGLTGVRTTNGLALGSRGDGDNNANVQFQEAIFYASDQSANRTGIESNINAYYNIY